MANTIITVTNSRELTAAFERLAAGEGGTIRLEANARPYEILLVDRGDLRVDAPVRLTSADPGEPARIAQLTLKSRENVTVDNVLFDSSGTQRVSNHRDLDINDSTDIVVTDSVFQGEATTALDGTPDRVKGVTMALVRGSDGVELRGNLVEGYLHGVSFQESRNLAFLDNEITRLQGDPIRIAGAQDLLIEGNHLHTMLGTSQHINHSDMIQFWGTNIQQNTERVTIRDNILNSAEGPAYQMIFGGNEDKAKNGWYFEDILIEGNLLYGAQHNMISVSNTRDMVVRHNTVLWNSDSHLIAHGGGEGASNNGWIRARDSKGAVIEGNLATTIYDATGTNGLIDYNDPSKKNHYGRNFINLDAGGTAELPDLSLLPGSPWDGKLGAPMTWSSHRVEAITAVVRTDRSASDLSVVELDASLSRDAAGRLGASAQYVWTFADGTVKRGQTVTHDFKEAGEHLYTLQVSKGGRFDEIDRKIEISEPTLLSLSMQGGKVLDASTYGSEVETKGGAIRDGGFVLDGSSKILIDRDSEQLYSLENFALSLNFAPDKPGAHGVLFVLPEAMQGAVLANGAFRFTITTTEGHATATTAPGTFSGTKARDLAVTYDGREVHVYLDGAEAASAPVKGLTKALEHWGLVIGNQWNGSVRGVVRDVALSAEIGGDGAPPLVKGDGGSGGGGSTAEEETLLALDFEGDLRDAEGRDIGVRAQGALDFQEGSDGQGAALGEGSVLIARENDFLHGRDSFEMAFDLKRDGSAEAGRLLHLNKAMDAWVSTDGTLSFGLTTDEGTFWVDTQAGALSARSWHEVEIGYDDASQRLRLEVDGQVYGTRASGETAEAKWWGLTLGAAWGDPLDATIDAFRLSDAPDWA